MKVRIGSALLSGRPVCGGSPPASILGNYLFCMSTDRLERGLVRKTEQEDKEYEAREGDEPRPCPPIDPGLARIRTDNHSNLGLNNVTVVADPVELCAFFCQRYGSAS